MRLFGWAWSGWRCWHCNRRIRDRHKRWFNATHGTTCWQCRCGYLTVRQTSVPKGTA